MKEGQTKNEIQRQVSKILSKKLYLVTLERIFFSFIPIGSQIFDSERFKNINWLKYFGQLSIKISHYIIAWIFTYSVSGRSEECCNILLKNIKTMQKAFLMHSIIFFLILLHDKNFCHSIRYQFRSALNIKMTYIIIVRYYILFIVLQTSHIPLSFNDISVSFYDWQLGLWFSGFICNHVIFGGIKLFCEGVLIPNYYR